MDGIENAVAAIGHYLSVEDRLVYLGLLVVVGFATHAVLGWLVRRLHRVARASSQNWDDVLVTALETPIRFVLWVLVAHIALRIYPVAKAVHEQLLQAYDTALVLLLAWFLHRLIKGIQQELLREDRGQRTSTDKATVNAAAKLARISLWIIVALMVLQSVGVSVSGLLAFGGIGGIAVGFAAKDVLANFFGGLSIYLDRPFTPGDWIRSPDREIEGTVEDIGWRLTRIRTFDQRPLYVPNAVFSQISVENPSRMFNRRIHETIGLRYQDAAKMGDIVEQVRSMLAAHKDIEPSRTLIVNFVSFGPSSLDFFVYAFTRTTVWIEFHQIKQDILLQVLDIIHRNGADVAFPTRTVQLENIAPEQDQ